MRSKGSGALFRVPSNEAEPLKYWQGCVEVPSDDGQRHRLTVRSKDYGTALRKLEIAKRQVRGQVRMPPLRTLPDLPPLLPSGSLGEWMRYWFERIATLTIKPKTAATYSAFINRHILPSIGTVPLTDLTPSDVRQLHKEIGAKGLSGASVLHAHRVLSVCLAQAVREGYIRRNVASLTPAPRKALPSLERLSAVDARHVIQISSNERLGSRWAAALLTGARQGELLGLELDRVGDQLDLSWQLQRLAWSHGCAGTCGWARGTDCPQRFLNAPADFECRHVTGGLWLTRPKSNSGRRTLPLVEPLRTIIERRIDEAAQETNPYGLLWTAQSGTPIDPRSDNREWHKLLERAGVPQTRLHAARHTVVDALYQAGVPEVIARDIVGHSTIEMTRSYRTNAGTEHLRHALELVGGSLLGEMSQIE